MRVWRFALVALAIIVVARAQDDDDDEDVAPQSGSGPQFASDEDMRKRQEQQQAVIQHILRSVSSDCRSELESLMSLPLEQQKSADLTASCKGEVQAVVNDLQQQQQQQGGGAAGGGDGGAAGGAAPAEPVDPRPLWPTIAGVLFVLVLAVGGLVLFVQHRANEKKAFLESHPDIARKLAKASRSAKKSRPGSKVQ